jgi:CHAD domain-containing protein
MSEKPALRPDMAVGEALRAVANDILDTARATLDDPGKTDAEAVHDFRKEMKRWRALLRLLRDFLGEEAEQLRIQARDLARSLSGARDSQAALDALDDLKARDLPLPARSLDTVQHRISAIRESHETTALTPDLRVRLSAVLDQASAAVEHWPLRAVNFPELAGWLSRGYRAVRRNLPADWTAADAEELHELRKRIITHRYQMEIVEPLWRRFGKMWVAENQRLRERLGKHQDLVTLESLTGPHQPLARWRARLAPFIAQRRASHVKAASRLARRLFVEKPGSFRRRLEVMWETG